jgi:hypothetical protein
MFIKVLPESIKLHKIKTINCSFERSETIAIFCFLITVDESNRSLTFQTRWMPNDSILTDVESPAEFRIVNELGMGIDYI